MAPLRVLIPVDHAVGVSGPHRHVVGTLNALGRRDDVDVVLCTGIVDRTEPFASYESVYIRLGFKPHDVKSVVPNLIRLQRAAIGADLIYVPSGLKALLYSQTARLGRPLVAGPNVTPLPLGNKRIDSPGRLELRYLTDAWIEASRARRDHVRRRTGDDRVGYIHHAIDTERFSPVHRNPALWESLGVPSHAVKVLFVGRDNKPLKGVAQLAEAIVILAERAQLPLYFIFVGVVSEETVERLRPYPHVIYDGFRKGDELAARYASADLSVVPSRWEGFGFTALEAQASGLPVVGSNGGAIPEIVEHERTGIIADIVADGRHRHDAGQRLADAILALASDDTRRHRYGENARKRVEEHFSEARLGDDLVNLFHRVLSREGAGGLAP